MDNSRKESRKPRLVTVAIVTYNRAHLLRKTLESLICLEDISSEDWELLVVNNNSTDDTSRMCESFADRLPIRVVLERKPGVSNARNCALRSVDSTYLVFVDDDVRVYPGWLKEFLDAAKRYPDAAAFGGPIEPDFPSTPDPDYVAAFPALAKGFCGLDHQRQEGVLPEDMAIWTANTAYRLTAVADLAFDPRLGSSPTRLMCGEEEKFLKELRARGGKVVWVPTMRVSHYVDPSRMRLPYLVAFQIGKGEEFVYQNDWADQAGTTVLGVPPRFAIKLLKAYLKYLMWRARGSKSEALTSLSRYCYYRGMIRAVRAERAKRAANAFTGIIQRGSTQRARAAEAH